MKKGFTIIEVLVIIAIFGILVLLTMPRITDQVSKARMAQIVNDIKAYENQIDAELIKDEDFTSKFKIISDEDIEKINQSNKAINKRGKNFNQLEGKNLLVNRDILPVNSKLPGIFIYMPNELIVYYDEKLNIEDEENPIACNVKPTKNPNYIPSSQKNFRWMDDVNGYDAVGKDKKGYYYYVGDEDVVVIPDVINDNPMTSYYRMFEFMGPNSNVSKIVSYNENITNTSKMFQYLEKTIDLSELYTGNVTNFYEMFLYAEMEELNLSKMQFCSAKDMRKMLFGLTIEGSFEIPFVKLKNVNMSEFLMWAEIEEVIFKDNSEFSNVDLTKFLYQSDTKSIRFGNNVSFKNGTNSTEMFAQIDAYEVHLGNNFTIKDSTSEKMFYQAEFENMSFGENFIIENSNASQMFLQMASARIPFVGNVHSILRFGENVKISNNSDVSKFLWQINVGEVYFDGLTIENNVNANEFLYQARANKISINGPVTIQDNVNANRFAYQMYFNDLIEGDEFNLGDNSSINENKENHSEGPVLMNEAFMGLSTINFGSSLHIGNISESSKMFYDYGSYMIGLKRELDISNIDLSNSARFEEIFSSQYVLKTIAIYVKNQENLDILSPYAPPTVPIKIKN